MNAQRRYLCIAGLVVVAVAVGVGLLTEVRDLNSSASQRGSPPNEVAHTSRTLEDASPVRDSKRDDVVHTVVTEDAELPDLAMHELEQRNPTLKAILEHRKPSKYVAVRSVDELAAIIREWRSLRKYNRSLNGPARDLLESARLLASVRDENWPVANWHLAQLLLDIGEVAESAGVYNRLLNESEIPIDDALRAKVMFKLGLMEFDRARAFWTETSVPSQRRLSMTSPGQSSFDVAEDLFARLRDYSDLDVCSRSLVETFSDAIERCRSYAADHPKQNLKYAVDVLGDLMLNFRTSVVLAQELYATGAHRAERNRLFQGLSDQMPEIVSNLEPLPLQERQIWATDAAWLLHEERDHAGVRDIIEPLVADGQVWEKVDAYLRAQHYLAYAYSRLGDEERLKAVAARLTAEGFDPEAMEPDQRVFFQGLQERLSAN